MGSKQKGTTECCDLQLLRYILFIFNFFFWLAGCAVLGIGIWTILAKHHYLSILSTPLFAISVYLLLVAGAIIVVLATIGCVGIHKEHRIFLLSYAILLLLVFTMEVVAGLVAYFYQAEIESDLKANLNTTFMEQYMVDDSATRAIDSLQRNFECCGAENYDDWQYSVWLTSSPDVKNSAPDTCCITYSQECGAFLGYNHPSNIFDKPCIYAIKKEVQQHSVIICAIGLGFCLVQILGALFACCMYRKLPPTGKDGYRNANNH